MLCPQSHPRVVREWGGGSVSRRSQPNIFSPHKRVSRGDVPIKIFRYKKDSKKFFSI